MSDRILGIIGPGLGPKVSTARMKRPLLKVVGMKEGMVTVHYGKKGESVKQCVNACGVYPLLPSEHMTVEYEGESKSAVCTIHAGKVDAVHST